MRLTVLGGSAAGPNPGQGCSGYLVESGGTRVVLDLGPGTLPELRRHADFRTIDGLVISHLHLDHTLDLLALRYALAYNPVPPIRRLPLWLPPGGTAWLGAIAGTLARSAGADFFSGFAISEFNPGSSLVVGDLSLRFHPTVHYVPCWAIRVSNGRDGDLLYTADTGPATDFQSFASGARVVVCEGTEQVALEAAGAARGHLTPSEAGKLARNVGAEFLVLTHLWFENDPFLAVDEAARAFGGQTELAVPGLRVAWSADRGPN